MELASLHASRGAYDFAEPCITLQKVTQISVIRLRMGTVHFLDLNQLTLASNQYVASLANVLLTCNWKKSYGDCYCCLH